MKWLKCKWGNLKRRWRMAMDGEDIILNAIDAIQTAREQIDWFALFAQRDVNDASVQAVIHMDMAIVMLKLAIDYHDEPEPIYPDDAMELADGAMPPIPAGYARHAQIYEDDGIEHVVPQNFRQQENA